MMVERSERTPFVTVLISLPLFYNPDNTGNREPIEEDKFRQAGNEVAEQFGGGVIHPSGQGFWWDRGFVDWDQLSLLEVDIPDTEENRDRIRAYAKRLCDRFRQKAIYIKFIGPVETAVVTAEQVGSTDETIGADESAEQ